MTVLNKKSKSKVLALFQRAYNTCPAYQQFIDSYQLDPSSIRSPRDISKIPVMDKENYLKKYPLEDRIIDNKSVADFYMITASSGSTGEPTFWLRDLTIDTFLEAKKEALYEQHFSISTKSSLIINTFALGIWTAGMLTSKLSWASAKNNRVTVMSTGTSKENILTCFHNLARYYDQVILLGYPPFLLDLVEFLEANNIDLQQSKIKILYTADSLSLKSKRYLLNKISEDGDPRSIVGFYASTDTGIIGAQTPLTVKLPQLFEQAGVTFTDRFGSNELPTLFAYDPLTKYLEVKDSEILISSDQPVPLLRYNIHDRGGIITGSELLALCQNAGISIDESELDPYYVYVQGKSNAVVLTANIYIEDIRFCLEQSSWSEKLSGHFKYGTEETENFRKRLVVHIFLRQGQMISAEEAQLFSEEFTNNLFKINTDLSVIRDATFEPIKFLFLQEENKYQGFKIHYFL